MVSFHDAFMAIGYGVAWGMWLGFPALIAGYIYAACQEHDKNG